MAQEIKREPGMKESEEVMIRGNTLDNFCIPEAIRKDEEEMQVKVERNLF